MGKRGKRLRVKRGKQGFEGAASEDEGAKKVKGRLNWCPLR